MLQLPTAETFFGPRLRRSLGQQIVDADSLHGDARWRGLSAKTGLPIAYWAFHLYGDDPVAVPPVETDQSCPLVVHIRHGRWLAVCECGSAQHASELDQRFYCVGCRNAAVGSRWRTVIWPERPQAIERALLSRPAGPRNRRHWLPHETVQQLEQQNELLAAMGAI